jgi:glycerol uptake facilitator-like aquaporin
MGQFFGGALGALWYTLLVGNSVTPYLDQPTFDLVKFLINEFVGTFFFCICLLALTNRFTTHAYKSWQIYLSIAAAFYLVRKYQILYVE